MMDDLLEILLQIVLDGGTEVIEQHKLSRKARIVICTLITLILIPTLYYMTEKKKYKKKPLK